MLNALMTSIIYNTAFFFTMPYKFPLLATGADNYLLSFKLNNPHPHLRLSLERPCRIFTGSNTCLETLSLA
jgi:hypothetical protein